MSTEYGIMFSSMGRIACEVEQKASDIFEYDQICKELSTFWKDGDESKLSPKAKTIWTNWKAYKQQEDINREEVKPW